MENLRKPFQGTLNIIRFNWHFYVIGPVIVILLLVVNSVVYPDWKNYGTILAVLFFFPILISLVISWYIYDYSPLYKFQFIRPTGHEKSICINIHSGFDETSVFLLENMCPQLLVFDFYDPDKHTEISIKRARKVYPQFPGTQHISTDCIPCDNNTVDRIFLIFAAHEIRNDEERNIFFTELNRILKTNGDIIIVEHLRNGWNFLAYSIGFLHFLPRKLWLNQFKQSGFRIADEIKPNIFITCFRLKKNGVTD